MQIYWNPFENNSELAGLSFQAKLMAFQHRLVGHQFFDSKTKEQNLVFGVLDYLFFPFLLIRYLENLSIKNSEKTRHYTLTDFLNYLFIPISALYAESKFLLSFIISICLSPIIWLVHLCDNNDRKRDTFYRAVISPNPFENLTRSTINAQSFASRLTRMRDILLGHFYLGENGEKVILWSILDWLCPVIPFLSWCYRRLADHSNESPGEFTWSDLFIFPAMIVATVLNILKYIIGELLAIILIPIVAIVHVVIKHAIANPAIEQAKKLPIAVLPEIISHSEQEESKEEPNNTVHSSISKTKEESDEEEYDEDFEVEDFSLDIDPVKLQPSGQILADFAEGDIPNAKTTISVIPVKQKHQTTATILLKVSGYNHVLKDRYHGYIEVKEENTASLKALLEVNYFNLSSKEIGLIEREIKDVKHVSSFIETCGMQ